LSCHDDRNKPIAAFVFKFLQLKLLFSLPKLLIEFLPKFVGLSLELAVWLMFLFSFLTPARGYLNELFFGDWREIIVRRIAWLLGLFITAVKSVFYSIIYGFKRFVGGTKQPPAKAGGCLVS